MRRRILHLIVLRTFSKGFGLADLRGGYIAAPTEVICILNKMGHPYSIGELGKRIPVEEDLPRLLNALKALDA